MDNKVLNREWVKNAAIIFLAVLLVLTFFSNTILNRSLPEAASKQVVSGPIVAKVRGSGTVEANGAHEVKMSQTKEIRSVMVKVGDEVKTGDVLFVLGAGDSEELEAAKEALRELQYSYQRAAINIPDLNNTSLTNALNKALADLEEAEKNFAIAEEAYKLRKEALLPEDEEQKDDNIKKIKAEMETAKSEMEAAAVILDNVKKSFNEKYAILSAAVTQWQNVVNEKTNIELPSAPVEEPSAPAEEPSAPIEEPSAPVEEPSAPVEEPSAPAEEPSAPAEEPSAPIEEPSAPIAEPDTPVTETSALVTETSKIMNMADTTDALSSVKVQLTTLQNSHRSKVVKLSPISIKSSSDLNSDITLELAKKKLAEAQAALEEFVASNESTVKNAQKVYDIAKQKYEALAKQYEYELDKETGEEIIKGILIQLAPLKEAMDAAEKRLNEAKYAEEEARNALASANISYEKTYALAALDLQQINEKIKLQQEKVKLLSGETEDQIKSNVNGIVQSISATAGNTVAADTLICTIEVPDMGHSISFSVTNDQARRLRTGDTATVSNFYWGNEIVATLTNIRTDPKNPQNNKVLSFELEGDVQSGSELTLSVGSKSANYDLIVPNSAIKSDSNGSFVLMVEAKNSPLGNRYIAKRVSVEVLGSDDNNSAIIAELSQGDFVITTSSAPIKSGDQVRLAEG